MLAWNFSVVPTGFDMKSITYCATWSFKVANNLFLSSEKLDIWYYQWWNMIFALNFCMKFCKLWSKFFYIDNILVLKKDSGQILFLKHFQYGKMLRICDHVSKSEQLRIKVFFQKYNHTKIFVYNMWKQKPYPVIISTKSLLYSLCSRRSLYYKQINDKYLHIYQNNVYFKTTSKNSWNLIVKKKEESF